VQPTPSVVATEVVDVDTGVEDVVCRLPRLLKSTMTCTRIRRKSCQVGWYWWTSGVHAGLVVGFEVRLHLFP
jgi:hypothetical protein